MVKKKNGVIINLTEREIKKLNKSLLKEQREVTKDVHQMLQNHSSPPNPQKKINQKDGN